MSIKLNKNKQFRELHLKTTFEISFKVQKIQILFETKMFKLYLKYQIIEM